MNFLEYIPVLKVFRSGNRADKKVMKYILESVATL